MTTRSPLLTETIECSLCSGAGKLKRTEVLDRLESDSPWIIEMYLSSVQPDLPAVGMAAAQEFLSQGRRRLMDYFHVFVLTSLSLNKNGDVKSRNVAVTFDLFEAEDHRNKNVENDYDTFVVPSDWREDAEQSELIAAMREFRTMVKQMQDAALR